MPTILGLARLNALNNPESYLSVIRTYRLFIVPGTVYRFAGIGIRPCPYAIPSYTTVRLCRRSIFPYRLGILIAAGVRTSAEHSRSTIHTPRRRLCLLRFVTLSGRYCCRQPWLLTIFQLFHFVAIVFATCSIFTVSRCT